MLEIPENMITRYTIVFPTQDEAIEAWKELIEDWFKFREKWLYYKGKERHKKKSSPSWARYW